MSAMTQRSPPLLRALSGAIVVGSGAVYAASAPRWIVGGDSGELAALYAAGGIAHPPGYPTMVLWLRLLHVLPVATPALGAGLATAISAMLAVLALQRACVAWGASLAVAAFVSAIYAFSPLAWELGSAPEVFAMNALFAGIILTLAGPKRPLGGAAGAVMLVFFAAPYGYEYAVAKTSNPLTTPMWIEEASLRGVWFHFERVAYGTLSLTGNGAARHPLAHVVALSSALVVETRGLPLVLAAPLFVAPARRALRAFPRAEIAALVASFLLAGPLFVGAFDLPFDGVATNIARRFYLLPELLVALMSAIALESLSLPLANRERWIVGVVAAVASLDVVVGLGAVREHNRPSVALYIENALRAAPPNAILVGTGDQRWGGFLYARYALHERPDVFFLAPRILPQAWYRRLAAAMTGADLSTPEGKATGPKTTLARLLATGRPVLYTDWPDAKLVDTPHYSVGPLMRILAPGETPPTDDELLSMNEATFASFSVESSAPTDPSSWAYPLQVDYARAWIELAVKLEDAGREQPAQDCLARGAAFAPWLVRAGAPE